MQAFLGFELGQTPFPNPVVSSDDGTERIAFTPKSGEELTYEGELNKVSSSLQ